MGRSPLDRQGVPLSTRIRRGSPRRAKQRRSVAWVSPAGTELQNPRGKNRGLQDRSGALVNNAKPTGLALGQFHLVGGIDLPGVVRPLGPVAGSASPPASGRGIQPGLGEGPLDGPLAGQGPVGILLSEDDPDDPGPPSRVLASHRDHFADQIDVGPTSLVPATPGVIGGDRSGPGLGKAGPQLPDRLGGQAQVVGDGVGLVAEASPLEDHLPLGYGNGSSHPTPPR